MRVFKDKGGKIRVEPIVERHYPKGLDPEEVRTIIETFEFMDKIGNRLPVEDEGVTRCTCM